MRSAIAAGVAGLVLLALAAPSEAVVVPFRNGRLTLQVELNGSFYQLQAPAGAPATGTVNVNRTATTLSSFSIPAGALSVTGTTLDIDGLFPVTGVIGTFANKAGSFSATGGGGFGGSMGLSLPGSAAAGLLAICVFEPCDSEFQEPVNVTLGVVGVGGTEVFDDILTFELTGGLWTIGTATVPVEGGQEIETGLLSVLNDGYMRVRLVTPVAIGIEDPPPAIPSQIAAFGLLDLEIAPAPEPGAAAAGLAGIGGLSILVRRRRRGLAPD